MPTFWKFKISCNFVGK